MPKLSHRRRAPLAAIVLGVTTLAVWAALRLAERPADLLERGDKIASIAGVVVGLAATVIAWRSARRPPAHEHGRLVADAADELAQEVGRQWDGEARNRGLEQPSPLRLRWASTSRPVAAPASEVLGAAWAGGRATRLKLHGTVEQIADAFWRLPAHQLVIIGPPGAGKTSLAVILVRALLRGRAPGGPAPVLLSLSTWDPVEQSLEAWLAESVRRQYPDLLAGRRFGPDVVARLLASDRILPILDGLDEIPAEARARAVSRLNNHMTRRPPMVVTCRAEEYEQVIGQVGATLGRAAVVEITAVSRAQIAEYLTAGQSEAGRQRWRPVLRRLADEPDGALARALSTPLMVHLARTAYRRPGSDPAELAGFADADAIEAHLLAAYVPALYPDADGPGSWPAARATTWLTFLARHLADTGSRELAWWRLIDAVPYRRPQDVLGCVAMVGVLTYAGAAILWRGVGDRESLAGFVVLPAALALVVGAPLGIVVGMVEGFPHRLRFAPRRLADGFVVGAALATCFLPVLLFAAVPMLDRGVASALAWAVAAQAGISVTCGVLVGAVALLTEGLVAPSIDDHLTHPRTMLRRDLHALLISAAVAAVAVGLILQTAFAAVALLMGRAADLWLGLPITVTFAAVIGPVIGVAGGAGSAWLRFQHARVWLRCRGRLPWRVLDFLNDAHDRGVLRKNGPEYQFRHVRLQEYLAGQPRR